MMSKLLPETCQIYPLKNSEVDPEALVISHQSAKSVSVRFLLIFPPENATFQVPLAFSTSW
jgi:hypothetical protein